MTSTIQGQAYALASTRFLQPVEHVTDPRLVEISERILAYETELYKEELNSSKIKERLDKLSSIHTLNLATQRIQTIKHLFTLAITTTALAVLGICLYHQVDQLDIETKREWAHYFGIHDKLVEQGFLPPIPPPPVTLPDTPKTYTELVLDYFKSWLS